MTGTGALYAPRWPRRRTAYERELAAIGEEEARELMAADARHDAMLERPAEPLGDEEMGGQIDG